MNKHILHILAFTLLVLTTSCQKDKEEYTSLSIQSDQYKTYGKAFIDEDGYNCWLNGDTLRINGETKTIVQDGNTCRINNILSNEDGYVAVYPASIATQSTILPTQSRIDNLLLPNKQHYQMVDGHQKTLSVMAAKLSTHNGYIQFHNAGIILAMDITNTFSRAVVVDSVVVSDNEAPLSGVFSITGLDNGTPTLTYAGTTSDDSTHSVTLVMPDNFLLSAHTGNCLLHISLPPTNSWDGNLFTISIYARDNENPLTRYEFIHTQNSQVNDIGEIERNRLLPIHIQMNDPHTTIITPLKGHGTVNNPYLIYTADDLHNMQLLVDMGYIPSTSDDMAYASAYYRLMNDINLNGISNLQPIGSSRNNFTGTFDGMGHTLSHLSISATHCAGLFGHVSHATIQNLTISHADITTTASDNACCGALCAYTTNSTFINHCRILGQVTFHNQSGSAYIGGLIGEGKINSRFCNCHCGATITLASGQSAHYLGGIAGHLTATTFLYNSHTLISTRRDSHQETTLIAGNANAGGLVGKIDNQSRLGNSYFGLNDKIEGGSGRTADLCAYIDNTSRLFACQFREIAYAQGNLTPGNAQSLFKYTNTSSECFYICNGSPTTDLLNSNLGLSGTEDFLPWHSESADAENYHAAPLITFTSE